MSIAYVVRCNFNDPTREADWNAWYNGPKLVQMLSKPHFLTSQRFHRVAGTGRDYLAFWTLASPEAFTTPEYKNDWGFFEWRPYIIDWSRDLLAAVDGTPVHAPRVADDRFLRIISFEGQSAPDAAALRAQVDAARPGMTWVESIGLDQHTALMGIAVEDDTALTPPIPGVVEVVYRPISIAATTTNPQDAARAI